MAKFACVCGETIQLSGDIPHPYEWHLLTDEFLEGNADRIDVDFVSTNSTLMFKCPRSGHLWIFWHGMDGDPSLYSPMDDPRFHSGSV